MVNVVSGLDADMVAVADERIRQSHIAMTAVGVMSARRSATDADVVFDGSQGPIPVKVSGTASAYEGDRVYLARHGGWWVVTGTVPARGVRELIAEIIVGVATTTVSFTSIPSTYTDLFLIGAMRTDAAATQAVDCRLRCNGDSSARYSYLTLDVRETQAGGAPSVSTAAGQTGFDWAATIPGASVFSGTRAGFEVTIFDYASTAFTTKEMRSISGFADVGTLQHMHFRWGVWDQTTLQAITSIEWAASAGNFSVGSRIALWGAK